MSSHNHSHLKVANHTLVQVATKRLNLFMFSFLGVCFNKSKSSDPFRNHSVARRVSF